jgi:ribosomal protein S18 acetylase RimI-like enzyme
MSNIVSIEETAESDLPAIWALLRELFSTVGNYHGIEHQKVIENYRLLVSDADSYLLVAKAEETVVGFITLRTHQTISHPGLSAVIDELVVSKGYRRQGIGELLVSAVIEKCRQLGCCELEVSTYKSSTEARDFYKRCGFREDTVLFGMDIDMGSTGKPNDRTKA